MTTSLDLPPRSEWLKIRQKHIGASDAAVIINGKHFETTPYKLWQEKLGIGAERKDNFAMKRGRLNEEYALQLYEKKTSNLMAPKMVFHSKHKFMMATLDGLSIKEDVAVEIKCPGFKDHIIAVNGKVPEKYYAQLQHQIACTDLEGMHYFSYREGEGTLLEVERNTFYIDELYEKETLFWEKVLTMTPPEMLDSDYKQTQCEEWETRSTSYRERGEIMKKLDKEHKEDKAWFVNECNGQSTKGFGLKVRHIISKGLVNYKSIPELDGIDLESYRGTPRESWMIRT